jgi:hypothetical protein
MKTDESWSEDGWKEVDLILSANKDLFRKEFKEWLKQRQQLWKKFVSYGLEAAKRNDPYGYSALALLQIVEFDTRNEPWQRLLGDYEYAAELGRLLIAMYPETSESLWRGERYTHPIIKCADFTAESFTEIHPEHEGFFIDANEVTDKNPNYMVFPELAGLPEVEPCGVGQGCGSPST